MLLILSSVSTLSNKQKDKETKKTWSERNKDETPFVGKGFFCAHLT